MKNALTFIFIFCTYCTIAQVSQVQYGKNRVQYTRAFADWSEYESENFITYWYGEGRFIGQAAAQIAETEYDAVQRLLEYRLNSKIEIIVYTDLTAVHQTNIGSDEIFQTHTEGVKVVGSKMFVYFNGDHTHLRRQVREGTAAVFLNAMIFGSSFQEILQNAIALNLPEWYKQGLVSYASEDWSVERDDRMRAYFQHKKIKNFNRWAAAEPRLAGHAFWQYMALQFGKANVSNLLYLTRINRDLGDAVLYVVGSDFKTLSANCLDYYKKRYENDLKEATKVENLSFLKIKNKHKAAITQVKMSPDGQRLAYVLNENGLWQVCIYDLKTHKKQRILRGGAINKHQATDYNYPLVAWTTDNQRVGIVYEKKDVIKILDYNTSDGKREKSDFQPDFQRVYSIDFINPREFVFSAARSGFSDIFTYNISNKNYKRITQDFWDDLDPHFTTILGKKGILFASNRQTERYDIAKLDTILPTGKFDIFWLNLEDTAHTLVQVTHSPDADERNPMTLDSTFFSFLSNESGVGNRQVAYIKDVLIRTDTVFYFRDATAARDSFVTLQDSIRKENFPKFKIDSSVLLPIYKKIAFTHNTTNYNHSIATQHSAPRVGKYVETYKSKFVPRVRLVTVPTDSAKTPTMSGYWYQQQRQKTLEKHHTTTPTVIKNRVVLPVADTFPKSDKPKRYIFQSEFEDTDTEKIADTDAAATQTVENIPPSVSAQNSELATAVSEKKVITFKQNRIIPYRLKFRMDDYSTRASNSPLYPELESYAANPQDAIAPPMGILSKMNFKELLEDYQIEFGVRMPLTFNGYESYAFFDNRKKRFDYRYALYHRSQRFTDFAGNFDARKARSQTTLGQFITRYPLSMYSRLQGVASMRLDKYSDLSTDSLTLVRLSQSTQRVGIKLEYIFDNTEDIDMNVKSGTRAKIWADVMKPFQFDFTDSLIFNIKNGYMGILAFDARHYVRVLKHSVFAVRFAGATSIGTQRTLYYMGSTDNAIFGGGFSDFVSIPQGDYAFRAPAPNMRGFKRNVRNGTSYALINTELRIPIFKYLSSKPINNFWRNIQLVGFADVGTAWHGSSPYNDDNPLNTVLVPANPTAGTPVVLTVNYFKDPLVGGVGAGVRMSLFGYIIRADYAWGIETKRLQKPMLHVSMGVDF